MIEKVLHPRNLTKSYYQVVRNKGSAGVDKMSVYKLASFREAKGEALIISLLNRNYVPQAIKGVEIPKGNGKTRLLGVPTVVDRWLQQAVSRQLATKFELEFEEQSYGFRPQRNIHKAVRQSLKQINDGYLIQYSRVFPRNRDQNAPQIYKYTYRSYYEFTLAHWGLNI